MRMAGVVIALSACGRVGFDPLAEGDGGLGSGSGSGSGLAACSMGTDSACFSNGLSLSNNTDGSGGNNLGMFTNDLAGTCGGGSGPDYGFQFIVLQTGTYEFTASAAFDTVIYALEGTTCSGVELGCEDVPGASGEVLTLALTQNQRIVVVVDSTGGCGDFSLRYRGL